MSHVTENQPAGTPTWIDLGVPDLDRALEFYGAVFGWEFEVGPPEAMRYTVCRLDGRAVAGLAQSDPSDTAFWWSVYLATDDCDATVRRITDAGGSVVVEPMDVMEQGRMAIVKDPVGAQFGLWQGRGLVGCETVNEPGSLLRNDLVTPDPEPARAFYGAVFDFTHDANPDLPELDFSFLRRPDGHEIGGIVGNPQAASAAWGTLFMVADADEVLARVAAGGGSAGQAENTPYGRMATVKDPFGAEFSVGSALADGSS